MSRICSNPVHDKAHQRTRTARLPYSPVPVRARHDGWTPERQIAFVKALAAEACVERAARSVGMSDRSARKLRLHPRARAFREAWDAALDVAMLQVEEGAVARSLRGVARPIYYKGEQVGEWRHHDERITMFLLRYRRPTRFGPWLDRVLPEPAPMPPGWEIDPARDETADELGAQCDEIEETGPLDDEEASEAEAPEAPEATEAPAAPEANP